MSAVNKKQKMEDLDKIADGLLAEWDLCPVGGCTYGHGHTGDHLTDEADIMRSVGGVYFTGSVQRARLFADRAVSVHGGQPVLVVADLEPRSAFADEDDVARMLRWACEISGGGDVSECFFGLLQGFDGISPHPMLRRRIETLLAEGMAIEKAKSSGSVSDDVALEYYDRLSRSMRRIAWDTRRNPSDRALRLTLPVRTDRGRNRILSMLLVERDNSLRPVFGPDRLPLTFFFQWRRAFGDLRFTEGC
jgi:hypothetical protein